MSTRAMTREEVRTAARLHLRGWNWSRIGAFLGRDRTYVREQVTKAAEVKQLRVTWFTGTEE